MKYYPDRGLHVMVCLNEHGNSGMEGIKYPILNLIWKTVWFWAELKPEESEVWRMYFYPLGLVFTALREKERRLREMYLKSFSCRPSATEQTGVLQNELQCVKEHTVFPLKSILNGFAEKPVQYMCVCERIACSCASSQTGLRRCVRRCVLCRWNLLECWRKTSYMTGL